MAQCVTAYLIVKGAAEAIEFYKKVFGAKEVLRMPGPDGRIGHADLKLGDSDIMLADEHPEMNIVSPTTLGNSPVHLLLYVDDVDATFNLAVANGAKVIRPVADQFYGDRTGTLDDPFGHKWTIATHKEDLTVEEIQRRAAQQQH